MEIGSGELPIYRLEKREESHQNPQLLTGTRRAQVALEQVTKHLQEIPF